jgi:hypothetical protein
MPPEGGYLQVVALEEATVGPDTRATVSGLGGSREFAYPESFTPNVGTRSTLVDFSGPVAYAGIADQLTEGGLADLDLSGTIAVILGPRASVEAMAALRARGAIGAVLVAPDEQTYNLYQRSRGETRLYHADTSVVSSFIPALPGIIAGPAMARALLSGTPLDRDGQPVPGPVGRRVSFRLQLERRSVSAENVVCVLQGSQESTRDTAIALSAHYDHLGTAPHSSGDSIYNGFSDNAAGVAALLAIAKAMASDSASPMRNSVLFLFLVGEERGLLGSDYYVARPAWPLELTRAVINIDAGAPPGLSVGWRLAGVDSTGLGAVGIEVARLRGWSVTTSPPRANSDYYPFVREGVPGAFIVPGPDPYEGLSADSSKALREKWGYYHHPDDEWTEDFPFAGLARYAEYGYLFARALDRYAGTLRN